MIVYYSVKWGTIKPLRCGAEIDERGCLHIDAQLIMLDLSWVSVASVLG